MKKAIVIAITMMLGLGLTAFAGPLSGSWATDLVVNPVAGTFTTLTSTLAVDYTVSGWTFGSSSGFTLSGFSSQSFTAGGSFGAFTLSSTMVFNPMFVYERVYTTFWVGKDTETQTYAVTICPITYDKLTAPRFLTWKTEGSISIGGVELGALFYISQNNDYKYTDYVTLASAVVAVDDLNDTYFCGADGSGWRFKVAGAIGDITATSYTYFNLSETDVSTTYCPAVGKSGSISIVAGDCDPSFYEEYILLEGIALGCATIDAGLSILCTGFNYVAFVVSDVAIGGWLELDFGLKFTTTTKSTDFCFVVAMPESDCLTIEFGLNDSANPDTSGSIDSIDFYGIGFTYAWEAITFSSYTELNANSALFSTAGAYDYLNGSTTNSYLVPFTGRDNPCVLEGVAEDATYYEVSEGYYELKCVYTERYKLWEKFMIEIDGDACCGGALDLTISTWFGDHEVLDWVYYDYVVNNTTTVTGETTLLAGTGTPTKTTAPSSSKIYDRVYFSTGYVAGTDTTLFNWAKFAVKASVSMGSNMTLSLGFNVSAYGWKSLDVGFLFEF